MKKHQLIEAQNHQPHKSSVMRFYFKVNTSKINKPDVVQRQLNKICDRLIKTHNIESKNATFKFGTIDDDFIYDRCRLEISFNCL